MRVAIGMLSIICVLVFASWIPAAETSEFARTTIDLGVVVSDVEASAKFYTDVIGLTEVKGFSVPADFCADSGLTNQHKLDVRVFVLGEGESATKLKLMQLPGVESKQNDHAYIHSSLGFSYITVFITDTKRALARLKKAGVAPIAKSPVELPKGLPQGVYLTVVRDPDGNLVELVGPKQ